MSVDELINMKLNISTCLQLYYTVIVFCTNFLVLGCLLAPREIDISHTVLPSEYVVLHSSVSFYPGHGILYSAFSAQQKSVTHSVAHSSHTRCSNTKQLLCLLLLAAGDIHPCPGPPKYRFPCGDCAKPVKSNQKGIACDTCNIWFHTKCLQMSDAVYFRLGADESLPWECRNCECPFNFSESFFNVSTSSEPGPEPPGAPMGTPDYTGSKNERHIAADFVELRRKYPRNFIITHINVNSLQYKFDEISIILSQKLVDCLFISETKLDGSHLDQRFKVDHYCMYRRDNPLDGGGGLIAYIRSDVPSYAVKPASAPLESLQINCILDGKRWSLLGVYRKPSLPTTSLTRLNDIIDRDLNMADNYIILGDMNINMLDQNTNNAVHQLCSEHNLTNIIKEPTCHKGENPTLIDLILVHNKQTIRAGKVTPCSISDFHSYVHGIFKCTMPRTTTRKIYYRSYRHFDPVDFGRDLRQAPFHVGEIFDIHSHMEFFQSIFSNILDSHAPIKTKIIKTNQCPHMTKEWKSAIFRRNMAHNKYLKQRTSKNFHVYRKLRNKCSNLSKSALKKYFGKHCTNTDKTFWKVIKPYFSKKSKSAENIQLDFEGNVVSEPEKIAEIFNTHYLNVATQIGADSPFANNVENHPSYDIISTYTRERGVPIFQFRTVSQSEVVDLLDRLPTGKAPGYDSISGQCIKSVKQEVGVPLTSLVNRMFTEHLFPNPLKKADVTPIYKKENRLSKENYRPVSVLISFSKVFEMAMSDQLDPHLKLIYHPLLSAYIKNIGCGSTLTFLLETWRRALDKDQYVGLVMMDLSKAFDCLPHDLLTNKLKYYNFDQGACGLMHSYLTDRTQCVKIGAVRSSGGTLLKGVPQGSLIGPKAFNVFINDLLIVLSTLCTPGNYADDNTVCVMHKDFHTMMSGLKKASETAIEWFDNNLMKANPNKFSFMVLSPFQNEHKNVYTLRIADVILTSVLQAPLLGITFDTELTFKPHVLNLIKSANFQLYTLKRLCGFVNTNTKLTILKAFIRSNFTYCCHI